MQADHPMFPAYEGRRDWGPSLMYDLHAGGAVMWIGGDGIMFLIILLLAMRAMRDGVRLTAGHWLEGVRTRRFDELATTATDVDASPATGRERAVVDDDDESRLAAYNDYLARLNGGTGSSAGSTR
jgi:putative copper resistance protein D